MNILCNHEEANYIIMYARFLAAAYIKKNAILFEGFIEGDPGQIGVDQGPQRLNTFITQNVEQVDVECDHPQIIAITNYLQQGVEINSVTQHRA